MATSDLNFTTKFWLFIVIFSRLDFFSKKCFVTEIFLQCFITARILESLVELFQIFDHRYSLKEAATGRCSFHIVLNLITLKLTC